MNTDWSWKEIDELERRKKFREALALLETECQKNPNQIKPLIRLGFLSWFLVVENPFFGDKGLRVEEIDAYSQLVSNLLLHGQKYFSEDPEFLWIFGYMLSVFPEYFSTLSMKDTETYGKELIEKAHRLRPDDKVIELIYRSEVAHSTNDSYMRELYNDVSTLLPSRFQGEGEMQRYFRDVLDKTTIST